MKFWWILLIIIGVSVLGSIIYLILTPFLRPVCTDDCRHVCNLEEKCCYRGCISGGCSGNGKDVGYYQKRGYITIQEIPEEVARQLLTGQGTEFRWCDSNLP